MPGIFISYRREDTAGHAGRIFDRLKEKFGRDKVFMDVAGIEPGVDFVEAIDQAVGACDVLLVIIGKNWLTCTDAAGNKRLDDPKDFIRLETATALRRKIRVVPVLVQDAAMPGEGDLPDDLKKLARRQATEIDDTHWDSDTEQLIETLAKVLPKEPKPAQLGTGGASHVSPPAEQKPNISIPVPFSLGKNKLTWVISAITAVGVAGLLFFLVPDKVVVPGLVGASFDEAVARLEQVHLKPGTVRPMPSDRPPGSVIEQDPAPGSQLPLESPVNLVLSENRPEGVVVPDLVGISLDEAVARLARARLRPGAVRPMESDRPSGSVIEQDPAPGSQLPPESPVNMVLAEKRPASEGAPTTKVMLVTVPNLVGQPLDKAYRLLDKAGLKGIKAAQKETHEAPQGTVIVQSPQAGSKRPRGETVELVIAISSAVSERVTVPDVTGLDVKQAVAILKETGLTVAQRIDKIETTKAEPGTVLKQSLKPGSRVASNEAISLAYAVAPPDGAAAGEIVLPDFTGSPIQKAEVFLREAGLVLGSVKKKTTKEYPAGTILDQQPPGKTRMEKGAKVNLLVAVSVSDGGERTNLPRTNINW